MNFFDEPPTPENNHGDGSKQSSTTGEAPPFVTDMAAHDLTVDEASLMYYEAQVARSLYRIFPEAALMLPMDGRVVAGQGGAPHIARFFRRKRPRAVHGLPIVPDH